MTHRRQLLFTAIGSVRAGRGNFGVVLDLPEPEEWMLDALCAQADPEAWYPEKGGSADPARRVCANCPVRSECLAYALEHDEHFGVWGGLSERQRRALAPIHLDIGEQAVRDDLRRALPTVLDEAS